MTQPNIVVIVTDDQPRGLLDAMPFVSTHIRDLGVNLSYGFATTPLCGPSRASLLTGKYAHTHGVWQNTPPGGFTAFEPLQAETLPVALAAAGYHTSLVGKYMNGWANVGNVPLGWHDFIAIKPDNGGDGAYYNYQLIGTVPAIHYANAPEDYSTDVLASEAEAIINTTPPDTPLFLYFAPYGAHAGFEPAPRHVGTWPLPTNLNPAVNEDVSDKSLWIRGLPTVSTSQIKEIIRDQHQTVMSVDEAVERIFVALGDRVADTLFVFLGDNGLQRGEHRLMGKNVAYQGSSHLQMLMRWDYHLPADLKDPKITRVIDLTATICRAADVTLPGSEGVAYGDPEPSGILLEGGPEDGAPAWVGWRTKGWLFLQYANGGGTELYDYADDPNELTNVAHLHSAKVAQMRSKAMGAATSLPPGFVW